MASTSGTTKAPLSASSNQDVTDQAVLDYLRRKGLGSAALELSNLLQSSSSTTEQPKKSAKEVLQEEEVASRNARSLLAKSTGGGYGYDRDAAWPIPQWGVPDNADGSDAMGVAEAKSYLDAFTSLQLWVLSLPDDDGLQVVENPLRRVKDILNEAPVESLLSSLSQPVKSASKDRLVQLPPSVKPELLAITFALLVHTYCELLEVGMESSAHTLRDAFRSLYDPIYGNEYRDLYHCVNTDDVVRLNSHNSQHMEALNSLKSILVQIASYQLRREELNAQVMTANLEKDQKAARDQKIQEYDRNIGILKQKYAELSQRATTAFSKMTDIPFLRRARAVRWQLTLSAQSYGMLAAFLRSKDNALLAMSTLLQTKCELHVEQRDPLPFTPACVLDEAGDGLNLNQADVNWAAPSLREEYTKDLPFPKFHLDEEYGDEIQAARDKHAVEFQRAMLINGFRRLEALERKRDYESMSEAAKERVQEGEPRTLTNPLNPSILLTTLGSNGSGSAAPTKGSGPDGLTLPRIAPPEVSAIWDESGIGLCCARICPPDGRRVAVGCDDSAIRIWNVMETGSEPTQVLLGHKNGFPVFDVDWGRDGRSLLSAGGDGAVRLWDTMASGPFGDLVELKPKTPGLPTTGPAGTQPDSMDIDSNEEPDMNVPGWKSEDAKYNSGAALAVYRGHAPSSPVWSVAFAPSGYYFASAGGDATARLWTTDRPVPVRLLCGHASMAVNCVEWHPNCNYVFSGSDDKTVRMWDVQTGRTVRLLTGCGAGINTLKVAPGGRYVAGADYRGIIHLWELGTGKKVTEFRPASSVKSTNGNAATQAMIHRLSFSACGAALASGGDSCIVKIWDVRSESLHEKPLITTPTKSFATRQTMIMDLQFTKRNLLLSVEKFVTPVPVLSDNGDIQ